MTNEKLIEKLQHKTDAAAASAEIVTNIMNDLEKELKVFVMKKDEPTTGIRLNSEYAAELEMLRQKMEDRYGFPVSSTKAVYHAIRLAQTNYNTECVKS